MKIVELQNVTKRFGDLAAVDDISLEARRGQIVSLLGPSGCGKTTTLRLIAGFETPDEGSVLIGGQDMGGKRPYERNVGLLFQDYALFPHMTVEDNISYGMRHRGVERSSIPKRTAEMLNLVKLNGFEKRRPAQLSGGQQQRVALARALATKPEVMLLDEPLSALDAKLRQELRVELKEILMSVGTASIVVTHDQEEAMSMAEHVIVQDRGRIMQQGTPYEIYARPSNRFVADFIGRSNSFSGRLGVEVESGLREFETTEGLKLIVPNPTNIGVGPYRVWVRQERTLVMRHSQTPSVDTEPNTNVIHGAVVETALLGADVHLVIDIGQDRRIGVTEKNVGQTIQAVGETVKLKFGAKDCIILQET
jgi:putative spermidine/putrescine transport system ATP-binding protein/putrescine transport system ATP-binding protein